MHEYGYKECLSLSEQSHSEVFHFHTVILSTLPGLHCPHVAPVDPPSASGVMEGDLPTHMFVLFTSFIECPRLYLYFHGFIFLITPA